MCDVYICAHHNTDIYVLHTDTSAVEGLRKVLDSIYTHKNVLHHRHVMKWKCLTCWTIDSLRIIASSLIESLIMLFLSACLIRLTDSRRVLGPRSPDISASASSAVIAESAAW